MPQINRIRVNNVKYNFGTQFYDDFVMRFSCRNSIYDLANGGGKSVLMLLLLQNLIPNCTLDDKQPVEKLFRTGNASTTIHSLIEWKLDACDVRSGYKYMTTGFCARKGRDNGDETDKNSEASSIEYFNYCVFYKEFGDNDIKNLPLSNGSERVTYNGLKSYLRDLEKKDLGVEVKIFDRKGDYQNFISNYGLYESQWEIVRGINKTEGHVRTYFENSYKTTRKIIEDLLIEEIIEKSYNNRIRRNSSTDDDEMARTLLDIKDKLIDLSKRKGEINNYDSQIELLENFAGGLSDFKGLFSDKIRLENQLLEYLVSSKRTLAAFDKQAEQINNSIADYEAAYEEENRQVAIAELETELVELDKLEALIEETQAKKEQLLTACEEIKNQLYLHENAADYEDYLQHKNTYEETRELINSQSMGHSQVITELNRLAVTKKLIVTSKIQALESDYANVLKACDTYSGEYEAAVEEQQNLYGNVKSKEGIKKELETETSELDKQLEDKMSQSGLVVADNIYELIERRQEELRTSEKTVKELDGLIEDNSSEIYNAEHRIASSENDIIQLELEIDREEKNFASVNEAEKHLDKIKEIYGASMVEELDKTVSSLCDRLTSEKVAASKELSGLLSYKSSITSHHLPDYEVHFKNVLDYLQGRYGEDIVTGQSIVTGMTEEDARELVAGFPQIPYVIFAKESFDEIVQDKVLKSLNTGSYIIPIIRKDTLDTGSILTEGDDMILGCRDMSFIWDETALNSKTAELDEDISRCEEQIRRAADKCQVVTNDLVYIRSISQTESAESIKQKINTLKTQVEDKEAQKESFIEKISVLKDKQQSLREALTSEKERVEILHREGIINNEIAALNDRLKKKYVQIKETETLLSKLHREYNQAVMKVKDRELKNSQAKADKARLEEQLERIKSDFAQNYKQYAVETALPYENLTEEEVDAKSGAMRRLLSEEMGDMADKEKLLAAYEASMKKCQDSIEYRGMSMEEAKEAYESGKLVRCNVSEMLELKKQVQEYNHKIAQLDSVMDSQSAQKNRIEGSIDHARGQYEGRYGEFVRKAVDNPQNFIVRHRQEMSAIKENLLKKQKEIKELESKNKDIFVMEKDLERIVKNAGLEIPEISTDETETSAMFTSSEYEETQHQYERLLKEELRRQNRFNDDKLKLIEELNKLSAYELSQEIGQSVEIPADIPEVENMINGLLETNKCIALERDRIEKSISDMERIKDSFENRCVQICSNIRTELDRLPKLSRITLDEDVISIITLSIPYIKEEMYKDRMSVYINETVSGAETFTVMEDKLKYIRGRLSWKRLFSVIVTDMNSIKLCLYKREHIKDQSRYLKYEEAVGSTGQSQGIYIQFLIAIINYISSINAAGKDSAVTGKTIFIDNPFGAAKDVYIWEPIFRLLKTNHVQLIVPARGATPAITKMFDVNYVLGQKMTAGRQQTVVVDYRSQVQAEDMDYQNIEYEQTTLDFS